MVVGPRSKKHGPAIAWYVVKFNAREFARAVECSAIDAPVRRSRDVTRRDARLASFGIGIRYLSGKRCAYDIGNMATLC